MVGKLYADRVTNEIIFFVTAILDLGFVLLMFRLGRKNGLVASMVVNIILVSTFGAKLIALFGLTTNAGNVFYGSIFLAVNLMVEHFGSKEGYRAVWIGFSALILFILMGQFVLGSVGASQSADVNSAMEVVFVGVPRIALASMVAYLVVMNFNVWLFDRLRLIWPNQLWGRNILSISLSQFIDSLIFFTIAFFGLLPLAILIQTAVVGFVLKIIVALLSTPFLYLGQVVKDD